MLRCLQRQILEPYQGAAGDREALRPFLPWVEEYVREEGLPELAKKDSRQMNLPWSDEEALDACLHRVRCFDDIGPYYEVQEVAKSTIWCID